MCHVSKTVSRMFAAALVDESMMTWGHRDHGGDGAAQDR